MNTRMLYSIILVAGIGLGISACGSATDNKAQEGSSKNSPVVQDIQAAAVQLVLDEDPDSQFLDIRTPEEYAAGHLPGSVNVDYRADDFEQQLEGLDKSKTYLMH